MNGERVLEEAAQNEMLGALHGYNRARLHVPYQYFIQHFLEWVASAKNFWLITTADRLIDRHKIPFCMIAVYDNFDKDL